MTYYIVYLACGLLSVSISTQECKLYEAGVFVFFTLFCFILFLLMYSRYLEHGVWYIVDTE